MWVWGSADGGATFSPGRRVNDTRRGNGRTQGLAAVSVSAGGRLDVTYDDRRDDPDDVLTEVSMQWSSDRGVTFTPRKVISSGRFDSRVGFGIERDMADLGSRSGLVSTDDGAVAVWTDTRAGNEVSIKQDLARAVVKIAEPALTEASASSLQAAGLVAMLAGLALAATTIVTPVLACGSYGDPEGSP